MTDTEEIERLKNALVAAEEALADAESDRFRWRGSIEDLVNHLWTTLPAEQVLQLQRAIHCHPLPIPAPPRPEQALREESANRLSEIEALRRALKDEERARVKLEAVAFDKEAYLRQLEARIAELATESNANEIAYTNQCSRSEELRSNAENVRKQLDAARHTLVGISDARLEDWQRILERAETAEARVLALEHELEGCSHTQPARLRTAEDRVEGPIALAEWDFFIGGTYYKEVCERLATVPLDLLRSLAKWANGGLSAVARVELARRRARRGER